MMGGVRLLATPQTIWPAIFNVLMALLCLGAAAFCVLTPNKPPALLRVVIVLVAGLHLFNLLGLYLAGSISNSTLTDNPWLLPPFQKVASVLPTSAAFTAFMPGHVMFMLLPGASLLMALFAPGLKEVYEKDDEA